MKASDVAAAVATIPVSININTRNKALPKEMAALNKGFEAQSLHIDDIVNHILEGHALSPAWMATDDEGHSIRKNNSFLQAQLVFLDIDNSETVNGVKVRRTDEQGYLPFSKIVDNETAQRTIFLAYTTPSHSMEWNRFRIVYCLPEPVQDVARYKDIIKAFVDRLHADEQCKAPVNIFYGNTQAEVHAWGNVLDWAFIDRLLHRTDDLRREERKANNHLNSSVTVKHIEDMLACIPAYISYDEWVRIISGIASHFDEDTTVKIVEAWSAGRTGEVRYKVRHRLQAIGIGTVIYIAKHYGYKAAHDLYADSMHDESAGLVFKGVQFRLTQSGNAERFVEAHKDKVRYCVEEGMWYVWDGRRLAPDLAGITTQLARNTFRSISKEAAVVEDGKQAEQVYKWAKASESKANIDAALDLAHRGSVLAVTADQLDSHVTHLNLQNGIFDLNTMTLNEHDIDQLHTKLVPIDFDEHAECPHWLKFLGEIFNNDQELISFMQRCVGYTLSGLTSEECLFFCYGSGQNGKSIFFSVVDMILGGHAAYAVKVKNDLIIMKHADPGVPMDIAELKGRRFVYTDELPENKRFDESKIKDITSHDKLTGRFIFQRSFTFDPSHKLWFYGNHRPVITGQDFGIWRRIMLIPFTVTIPAEQRKPAEELKNLFRSELPGILRWAIDGFYTWKHEGGLSAPSVVSGAVASYRTEMDNLGAFIDAALEAVPGACITQKEVYRLYKAWCIENGFQHILTSRKLSMILFEQKKWASTLDRQQSRIWQGWQPAFDSQQLAAF